MEERLLIAPEVQRKLRISRTMVYSDRVQRALGAIHIFGAVRYPESRVLEAMRRGLQAVADDADQADAR